MILSPESFNSFIKLYEDGVPTIGLAEDLTENPVYVNVIKDDPNLLATCFSVS